ncbi:hypothetical protein FNF27_03158 [Cafeteria roenbergensis]|uniref:Uncharacterized protein n=2 Tax=Cafeteria roenbergensis TaxID=33653 RepID=A0A5A8EDW8_CAFRO|nr:hypothetical protein FNF27_03158 [Cafeteria roenbergensis]
MLAKGATEPLQFPDVFPLPAEQESTGIHGVFDAAWKQQLSQHGEAGASIWAAIYAAAGWRFWSSGALLLAATVASLLESFALENLLAALDAEDISESVAWAAVLVGLGTVYVFANQHMAMQGMEMGMRGRTALTAALHAKLLRVPSGVSRGLMSTLVGTDAAKMTDLGWDFHYIWASPITLLVALAMCWRLLGPAILPAVGVAVILIPVNVAITAAFTETENDIMAHRQRRMASISEAAGSILGVKLFGWEGRVARRIARHRIRELRHVRRFSLGVASVMSVVLSMSTLMACAAFGTYSLTGGTLTSAVVFPALYLIQLTSWPLLQLPYVLSALGAACASMSRIRRFLLGKEVVAAARAEDDRAATALVGGSPPAGASASGEPASYAAAAGAPSGPLVASGSDDVIVLERATLRWPRPSRVARRRDQEAQGAGGDDPSCLTMALRNSWFRGRPAVVPATSADSGVAEPLLDAADSSADADAVLTAATGKRGRPRAPVLHDVTLRVPRGQLVAVIGPVGSGKSSLLAAVLGELEAAGGAARRSGTVGVRGRVALVPQSSWVRSSTVRANVSMAAPPSRTDAAQPGGEAGGETAEEAERAYGAVLDACCLRPDLELLAHGEATEVGESGVSLSGGQKARVTLARAVRSGLDVALLDDPLSAVDAHVGARLFHDVVCGALAGSTRLLVTHQLQFLPQVDRILVMRHGRIAHDGTYEELLAAGVKFASLLEQVADEEGAEDKAAGAGEGEAARMSGAGAALSVDGLTAGAGEAAAERGEEDAAVASLGSPPTAPASARGSVGGPAGHAKSGRGAGFAGAAGEGGPADHIGAGVLLEALRVPHLSREGSHSSVPWSPKRASARNAGGETPAAADAAGAGGGSLVSDEDRYSGTVGAGVFMAYGASLGGIGFAVWFVLLSLGLELTSTGGSAFLALWADAADGKATSPPPFASDVNPPPSYWVSVYFALGLLSTAASLFRNFAWFEATFRASRRLHDRVVSALLRAPLSFWTSTPSGRILNRLSKDVGVVDQELPDYTSDVLLCVVECIARLTTIAVASPIFLLVFLPVGVFYYIVTKYYRGSSRELKRLEAIASSPLQARFAETVEGLPSIRAFGLQASERRAAAAALDNSNTLFWVSRMANRWISVRVEFSGSIIVAAVAAIAVVTTVPAVQPYVPGVRSLLALALTYSINLTGTLNWLVRCVTTAEAEFSRVERLYHFASIASEAPLDGKAPAATLAGSVPGPAVAPGSGGDADDAALMLGAPITPAVAHASSTGTMASEALVEAAAGIVGGTDADQWAGTEEHRRQRRPAEEVRKPPAGWPSRGQLVFRDVWMRYRPDLAPVLRGVTVQIEAGTRVGIVGRTGAGKSSLFGALFRTVELCRGGIELDGVDTSSVGLRAVRSAIAAVPQDPVLWSGSLRAALDPSGPDEETRGSAGRKDSEAKAAAKKDSTDEDEDDDEDDDEGEDGAGGADHGDDEEGHEDGAAVDCLTRCVCGDPHRPISEAEVRSGMRWDERRGLPAAPPPTDEELLGALEAVGLGEWARTFTLDGRLEEGGRNLSLGTRQLLALARTLLRRSAVIALDEATASVSPAEDNAIQVALQTAFRGRTVLAVAHRLPTVIGYDRILVMDAGRLCEWGSPAQLLRIPGADAAAGAQRSPLVTGLFASMVAETGAPSEAALRAAAATAAGL